MGEGDKPYRTWSPWHKKIPVASVIILTLLLGAWLFRWDTVASKTHSDGVAKWERDRWSGQVWYVRYSKQFYNKKPVGGDSTKSDVATGIWLVLFVGNIAYAVYRQV